LFALQDELFSVLADRGFSGLRPRHGAVLAYLDPDGTRPGRLAQLAGIHKQRMSVALDELVALGYVVRRVDPADRRARLVVPTERGLAAVLEGEVINRAIEQGHADALAASTFDRFVDTMRVVTARQRAWRTRANGQGTKDVRRSRQPERDGESG
jgi:DNA-binding MarR family transcriptional regulator